MADVRADSDHRRTEVPIASDTLPGFGLVVGPAPPSAPALARASAPAAFPGLVPAVSAQSSATERRGADAFFFWFLPGYTQVGSSLDVLTCLLML